MPFLIQPLVEPLSLDHPPVACHPFGASQYAGILLGLFDNKVNFSLSFPLLLFHFLRLLRTYLSSGFMRMIVVVLPISPSGLTWVV